jgi:two-component system, OmpR family, manganese sensing sensor histidine kinase
LQTIRESRYNPLALERRLLFSYLIAFAVIFVMAAVAVHFAFSNIVKQQTLVRLGDLARAGMRSVIFDGDTLTVDRSEVSRKELLTPNQGLQWFDAHGRRLAAQGLTPRSRAADEFLSVSAPILNPATHRRIGSVLASEWNQEERTRLAYLDTGLLAGALLAALSAAAAGVTLARRAVRPVERSFQALREFTDNASHELRGPLTAIATSADAALRDPERDPEHDRRRFETISDGAKQMSRLTSDLLLLAGADRSLERELFVVDLAATMHRLVQQYRPRFDAAHVALEASVDEPLVIYGNPDQVERVVANLIDNALRYTTAGGCVAVECRRQATEIQIAVRDSGIGIAPENLERIFERFWRADPVRAPEGSGLGLAIARALARRHSGDVTVSSRPGQGSTFVATFPVNPRQSVLQRRLLTSS